MQGTMVQLTLRLIIKYRKNAKWHVENADIGNVVDNVFIDLPFFLSVDPFKLICKGNALSKAK